MFGLAVVSAFSMVVRFHHSPSLHPDIFMYPISSLSIYLHTHITHKPSPCRTIYKSFCFPENWSLCFPFVFVLEVVAIYSFHTCPLVSPLALSLSLHRHYTYALTFLSFLYILYCLFYVPLFLLPLSIVYLPLFLYQSFYHISPPRINPLPLSFSRSPSSFLSHRGGLSLSLSLSLSLVRLFCGFDFLSDLHVPPT